MQSIDLTRPNLRLEGLSERDQIQNAITDLERKVIRFRSACLSCFSRSIDRQNLTDAQSELRIKTAVGIDMSALLQDLRQPEASSFSVQSKRLIDWCKHDALPLWEEYGVDKAGGFYETLNYDGSPDLTVKRRVRVQARQCYVYSLAITNEWFAPSREVSDHGWSFLSQQGLQGGNHISSTGFKGCANLLSRKVARQRRDICADADEQRWHEVVPSRFSPTPREASYRDVSHHVRSLGFNYEPMDSLISRDTVTDLLQRLQALGPLNETPQPKEAQDAEALLGVVKTPSTTITQAMDLYLSEIVADELASKSLEQVKNFSKIKRRAVANFVNINGDIDMRDITREHAHAVRKFWHERIHPKDGSKPMSGSSGNKDLGSLRKLYRRYFEHIGEEERENPFRNMRFNAAAEKLESMTGKAHVAAQNGRLIEGTVSQKYELPHGPHAMIETQRAFYLVLGRATMPISGASASRAAFLAAEALIGIRGGAEGLGGDVIKGV